MHRTILLLSAAVLGSSGASACRATSPAVDAPADDVLPEARLYPGYGGYARPVSGASEEGQRWIDQGLQLVYGFNHDEALRAFRRATALDPDCPMAWWGVAYANGIDVNDPAMSAEASAEGYQASREALALVEHATPVERALIEAQAERYASPAPEDRSHLDQAYADAMEAAWQHFPDDPDVGALFAEALMVLQPWDYWTAEGEPVGRAEELVATLEQAIAANPLHPGANHFYIHAVEASPDVERAVASADRLRALVPGSGHLVHMPSHVYINVGRYGDAADANEAAIAADRAYFELAPPPEFYRLYYIHNIHFLTFAAMMEGRSELALESARQIEAGVPQAFLEEHLKLADGLMPMPLHVLIRFGRWEEVLDEPAYPAERLVSRAIRHYARAVALANLGRTAEGRAELAQLTALRQEIAADEDWVIGVNPADEVLAIAATMTEGELLWNEGEKEAGLGKLRAAVALEDGLVYAEPPGWMQPVRHALGALLLKAGRLEEAAAVYRADLEDNPENAWALLGLERALRTLGETDAADALRPRCEAAWSRADVSPEVSCYCALSGD